LQELDRHLLQVAGEQISLSVGLRDLLQLLVVVLEVRKVDVRDVDVGVATQTTVLFN
jgi:hypothetical protein